MIRTATEAIAATLPLGTVAYEAEHDADEQINELLRVVDRDGDDEAPECRWAGGRTAGIDPLLPFLVGPGAGGMRQERPFPKQAANASIRPQAVIPRIARG